MLSFDLLMRMLNISQASEADFAEIYAEDSFFGSLLQEDGHWEQAHLSVNLIAQARSHTESAFLSFGGTNLWQWPSLEDIEKELSVSAAKAINLLSAPEAKAGPATVIMIITAAAGGTLVHEACGHGLELDLVRRRSSVYKEILGTTVAAPQAQIIYDATIPDLFGSYDWDDEGVAAQKTILIENGILINYMCDQHNAWQDGRLLATVGANPWRCGPYAPHE